MKRKVLSLVALAGLASQTFAAQIFGQDVNIDVQPVLTMAGIVIAAIGSIWAVKKVIALANRS